LTIRQLLRSHSSSGYRRRLKYYVRQQRDEYLDEGARWVIEAMSAPRGFRRRSSLSRAFLATVLVGARLERVDKVLVYWYVEGPLSSRPVSNGGEKGRLYLTFNR
jgi:hypothetical protein